jgi:membrane protease YdiL (CAAX protease family)
MNLTAWLERWRPLLPIPVLLVVGPCLWLMFRRTWYELDLAAHRTRGDHLREGRVDPRPMVSLIIAALILTLQEYYGGRSMYDRNIRPWLGDYAAAHGWRDRLMLFDELAGFYWWAGTRIFGYLLPFVLWKIVFPRDSILDLGLRTKGFFKHLWIYGSFLAVMLPLLVLMSHQSDFGSYYPFYRQASRSWLDFLAWEFIYFFQFFALECFFRGWWLGALRSSMGSAAIFAMSVPYCMIHYGKPFLEANGAIVAGIALGSLAMRTKSIYSGFLVHITVAAIMDWTSLASRHALPTEWLPPGFRH